MIELEKADVFFFWRVIYLSSEKALRFMGDMLLTEFYLPFNFSCDVKMKGSS